MIIIVPRPSKYPLTHNIKTLFFSVILQYSIFWGSNGINSSFTKGALGEFQSRGAGRGPRALRRGGFSHGAAADVALAARELADAHRGDAGTGPMTWGAGQSHRMHHINGFQCEVMVQWLGMIWGYYFRKHPFWPVEKGDFIPWKGGD